MKWNLLIALGCLCSLSIAVVCAETDAVSQAIQKFEKSRRPSTNEVTVTLPPPQTSSTPGITSSSDTQTTPGPTNAPAASQSPSPPPQVPPTPEVSEPPAPPPAPESPAPSTQDPAPSGISTDVRKIESDDRPLDISSIKILAPFPAKPLAHAPAGWRIEPSAQIPPFTEEVELEKGKTITLSVKPHVLVADTDGFLSFTIPEPGYNTDLEYQQNATIGAILAGSIRQLDEDSKKLSSALEQLDQLLISLPKPKAKPVTLPEELNPVLPP